MSRTVRVLGTFLVLIGLIAPVLTQATDVWILPANSNTVYASGLQAPPPPPPANASDFDGVWQGTLTATSAEGMELKLNQPYPQKATLAPSGPQAGKVSFESDDALNTPEGTFAYKDGRLTANVAVTNSDGSESITLDGPVEAVGNDYVWQGTYTYSVKSGNDSASSRGTAKLSLPAKNLGKPLCAEALAKYPDFKKHLKPGITDDLPMKVDYDDLQKDLEQGILRFEKAGGTAKITDNFMGTLPAASWLQNYGGTIDKISKNFVFGRSTDISKSYKDASPGTESALVNDMQNQFISTGQQLTAGDILNLALKERSGNVGEALLLAHNTLRSLARPMDNELTGVAPNPVFFEKILKPMRKPEIYADSGQTLGDWYHLFGTAYFEVQTRGEVGPGKVIGLANWMEALFTGSISDTTAASDAAGVAEDWFRQSWLGGSHTPDPEKLCLNNYGARLGGWLYQYRFSSTSASSPSSPSSASPPSAAWQPGVGDPVMQLMQSPANVTWEIEKPGYKLVLDQKIQSLTGYAPIALMPFYEAGPGTWGAAWISPGTFPTKLSFEAVKDGDIHLTSIDRKTGSVAQYVFKAKQGEKATLAPYVPGESFPPLVRSDGTAIQPSLSHIAPTANSSVSEPSTTKNPVSSGDPSGVLWLSVGFLAVLGGGIAVRRMTGRHHSPSPVATQSEEASVGVRSQAPAAGPASRPAGPAAPDARTLAVRPAGAVCASCGTPVIEGAKFCSVCGQPVTQGPAYCIQCGKELTEGAAFCGYCGARTAGAPAGSSLAPVLTPGGAATVLTAGTVATGPGAQTSAAQQEAPVAAAKAGARHSGLLFLVGIICVALTLLQPAIFFVDAGLFSWLWLRGARKRAVLLAFLVVGVGVVALARIK